MNGITVIAEHLCRVVELKELIGTVIFVTLICVGGLLLYRWTYNKYSIKDKKTKITYFIGSILLVVMNIWFCVSQINDYNTVHMEYTVTIDDSVSFNDFYEKYEILSMNDNEFRVMEK